MINCGAFPIPPGDPSELRAAAAMLRRLAGDHAALKSSVQRHTAMAEEGWSGGFADRFRVCAAQVSGRFEPVCEAAADAAIALADYAAALEGAQHAMAALNTEADHVRSVRLDPADQAHAMSQLASQSEEITSRLDHTASVCASRLTWNEHSLTQLPGTDATEQLLADIRRAAAGQAGQNQPGPWERTEPERKTLEGFLAPFDMAGGDFWLELFKKAGENRESLLDPLDEEIKTAEQMIRDGKPAADQLMKAVEALGRAESRLDAWDAFAPRWARAVAGYLSQIKGLSYTMDGLGIIADAGTLVSPQDSGSLGNIDRGVAAFNAGGLALDAALSTGWITTADGVALTMPVVGEVAITVTGAYLAGDFVYHHRVAIEHFAEDVGRAVVHGVSGDVHEADEAGHAVRSAWHSVTSTIGSWF